MGICDIQSDEKTFASKKGKELYALLLKKRKERLDTSEKITEMTEEAKEEAHTEEPAIEEPAPQPEANLVHFPVKRTYYSDQNVTLLDLLNWYQNKEVDAVRGQEKAMVKMTLKAIMLNSFTVEGPAGRGKTYLLKALTSVLPTDKVYWFEFATDTTLFNKAEYINKYQILMIPEYQKILKSCPQTREAIKTISEGRVAKRQKMDDGVIKEYTLLPKCVITAIADENEFKEILDKDKEDMRRFSHIKVDTSYDTTLKIREFKRQKRSMLSDRLQVADESLGARIQAHLSECIDLKLESPPLDPFAEFMDKYLPMTDKSIAYIDDYYSYLDGSARFHHKDRMIEYGHKKVLALDLADHYLIHQIYHAEFCQTLLKLDNLENFGDRGQKCLEPVDWKACFEAGIAKMRESLPGVTVDKWIARQLKDNNLVVTDIITQEEKALFQYDRGEPRQI